jgi:26S proteasome regulatory subunit N3
VKHIEKAVSTKEPRYMIRVIRGLVSLRRKLNHTILRKAINGYSPAVSPQKEAYLSFLDEVNVG